MAKLVQLKDKDGLVYPITKGKVLFNGDTNGTVTLNETSANYEYLEIFYRNNDQQYSSVKVYQPNGKQVSLFSCFVNNTDYLMIKGAKVTISGTSIIKNGYAEFNAKGQTSITWANNTFITRVIGYK